MSGRHLFHVEYSPTRVYLYKGKVTISGTFIIWIMIIWIMIQNGGFRNPPKGGLK